jgi:hypothetical protein
MDLADGSKEGYRKSDPAAGSEVNFWKRDPSAGSESKLLEGRSNVSRLLGEISSCRE